MSTQQKRVELLTFGYVNKAYDGTVPFQLVKLMNMFYDEHFYWIIKDKKLEKFMKAEVHEKIICSKSFTIKGIIFVMFAYPNGNKVSHKGLVRAGFKIKYWPVDIEYVEFYYQITCETFDISIKRLYKAVTDTNWLFHGTICKLHELKHMKNVIFNSMVNIKYIKYKKNCNKIDYYSPINQMQKHSTFTWNINGLLMKICKKMVYKQSVFSPSFENDNWCIWLYPKGRIYQGVTSIYVSCLSLPYTIKGIDVKITFSVDCGAGTIEKIKKQSFEHGGASGAGPDKIISFNEFKKNEAISFNVTVEIVNIFDKDNEMVPQDEWEKYCIMMNHAKTM